MPQPEPLQTDALRVCHGFFTRVGGVSKGPYASLNCSLSSQDSRQSVLENRARAARALGADPARLVGSLQVHGTTVIHVTEPWPAGEGPEADAMVSDLPGIALGIVSADCAPVLFADERGKIIGAAHAGWRGATAGVLEATIAAMVALGAEARTMTAVVGPCIAAVSYEVGPDMRDVVVADAWAAARFFAAGRRPERWQFDLPGYCVARLGDAGVGTVARVAADTCAGEEKFFSHRRRTLAGGGPIGHQISIVALPA